MQPSEFQIQSVGPCNVFSRDIPRINFDWRKRLSIRVNVVTNATKLVNFFFLMRTSVFPMRECVTCAQSNCSSFSKENK